ncbi:MAG TPA: flagellar biosynthesis protein FlhF [Clostridia bacterium]|nr:flagellar biosynthesis protein FlhF [Clostridia bacterium]
MKSYIVKDMSEAMEKIRRELGPEAIILSNRELKQKGVSGWFKKPLIEVMVAYEIAPEKHGFLEKTAQPVKIAAVPEKGAQPVTTVKTAPRMSTEPSFTPAQFDKLVAAREEKQERDDADDHKQICDRLNEIKVVASGAAAKANASAPIPAPAVKKPPQKLNAEVTRIYETLVEHDVHFSVARKIARQTQELSARAGEDPLRVAQSLIADALGESAAIRLKKYRMNVIALVGPTGVGKTTTLVKLAGLFTIDQNLKVGFVNTDTYRVAAQEQIKTYAEIMDIPLHTLYSPEEMEHALSELDDRDVVLIDTAGKSMVNKEYVKEVEAYMNQSSADEILLTVSASMGFSACKAFLDQFAFLKTAKLVVTKLDEMVSWGNVLNIAYLAQKPIAYVTMGQNVPYDIERFDVRKAVDNILESTGA